MRASHVRCCGTPSLPLRRRSLIAIILSGALLLMWLQWSIASRLRRQPSAEAADAQAGAIQVSLSDRAATALPVAWRDANDALRLEWHSGRDCLGEECVLILTPLKNSARHLAKYFRNINNISFPARSHLSVGLLESDSDDSDVPSEDVRAARALLSKWASGSSEDLNVSMSATLTRMILQVPRLIEQGWRRVSIVKHDFGKALARNMRHGQDVQLERRKMLAESRNHLLVSALRDESHVLWLDSDVHWYPADVVQQLLAARKPIIVANVVMGFGQRTYDINSWRSPEPCPGNNATAREVRRYFDALEQSAGLDKSTLLLEGYGSSRNVPLHKLKHLGRVVRIDAVGGAMLLVQAEVHRLGVVFPPFVYRHRIETEGLSMMALDMGILSYAMPGLEVIHH